MLPHMSKALKDPVGAKEAYEIIGVDKQTFWRWRQPGSGKPHSSHGEDRTYMIPPAKRAGSRPLWERADVQSFARDVGRQRARARRNTDDTDGHTEARTTILLEHDRQLSVAESPDEVLHAIADARKPDHATGMAKVTVIPPLAENAHDAWIDPATVRLVHPTGFSE